jgi:hypothetical protein
MSVICSQSPVLYLNGEPVPDVLLATLSVTADLHETTCRLDRFRTYMPGLTRAELDFRAFATIKAQELLERRDPFEVRVGLDLGHALSVPGYDDEECYGCGSQVSGDCLYCGRINDLSCQFCGAPDIGRLLCGYCGSAWPGRVEPPNYGGTYSFKGVLSSYSTIAAPGAILETSATVVSVGPVERHGYRP